LQGFAQFLRDVMVSSNTYVMPAVSLRYIFSVP